MVPGEHDDDEIPTGLPEGEEAAEAAPLGPAEDDPAPTSGEDAMPGIVTDGDPPDAG